MLKAIPMFQVVYTGDGVASNKLGAFQHGTTAYTPDADVAREIAESSAAWRVTSPDGVVLGQHREPVAPVMSTKFSSTPAAEFSVDADDHGKRQDGSKKSKSRGDD